MLCFQSVVSVVGEKARRGRGLVAGLMLLLASSSLVLLSGCGMGAAAPGVDSQGMAIEGMVHGGRQPISGAKIYLYAAGTTGYASASTSLLTSSAGHQDGNGNYYVTTATDGTGKFTITGDWNCPAAPGDQVYLLSVGGDPGNGGTPNPDLVLMAAVGSCGNFTGSSYVVINEVSTVASAYALAQFMNYPNDGSTSPNAGTPPQLGAPTHGASCNTNGNWLSTGPATCNYTGLKNAFATVHNLVDMPSGLTFSVTPAYAGNVNGANTSYVPGQRINTLANILAACVNSTGVSTGAGDGTTCGSLFEATTPTSTSVPPTDTLQAILNLAQSPYLSTANGNEFFGLASSIAPFGSPAPLTSAPTDWTLALAFTGGGLGLADTASCTDNHLCVMSGRTSGLAIDASGDPWVTVLNSFGTGHVLQPGMVVELSNLGAPLSPATTVTTYGGYQAAGLNAPQSLAIDQTGNVWVGNNNGSLTVLNAGGSVVSGMGSITDTRVGSQGIAGLTGSVLGLAVDASGNVWTGSGDTTVNGGTGALAKFNGSTGAVLTPAGGYTPVPTTGVNVGYQAGALGNIALDTTGNVWVFDHQFGDLYQVNASTGALTLEHPDSFVSSLGLSIGIDASGNVFDFSNTSLVIKQNGSSRTVTPLSTSSRIGSSLAVDGAGSVWAVGPTTGGSYSGGGYLDGWSSTGARLAPATTGYTGIGGGGEILATTPLLGNSQQQQDTGVAVDESGNVWVLNGDNASGYRGQLAEFVGLAAPVQTPISVALKYSNLGTRP